MFLWKLLWRTLPRTPDHAARIEGLERRKLFSGYTTVTVGSFGSVGLNSPSQTVVQDSAGDIFGIADGGADMDGAIWVIPAANRQLVVVASFDGINGSSPSGGLFEDSNGDLYGVCSAGGTSNLGTLWELVSGQNSITVLGSFSAATGSSPSGQIFVDSSGNVFGTNQGQVQGPAYGNIWEYSAGTQTITDLADFNNTTNGANPDGGLISDGNGNLFGTTFNGGTSGNGTIWEFQIGGTSIATLASFDGASEGAAPDGGIAIDSNGNLFGTSLGPVNSNSDDNAWELPAGSQSILTLAFFPVGKGEHFYGAAPTAPIFLNANDDVIGTAEFGGATNQGSVWGVPFGSNRMVVLHSFTFAGGHEPNSSILLDSIGDIFGTTQLGGVDNDGTAFLMLPPGNIPSTHLGFAVQPVNTAANGDFTANVQVDIEGAGNQTARIDNSAVTLSISKGLPGATLGGTVTVNAIDGVATFTGLTLNAAGSFSLKATDGVLKPAISRSFMVPALVQLVVAQEPADVTAGTNMQVPVAIEVEDQFGNALSSSHAPVRLAIQSGPALAKLEGFSATPKDGVAMFKTLGAAKAGIYALTVSDGTAAPLALNRFTVSPGPATKMLFSTQPIAAALAMPFTADVELLDRYGNVATNDTSDVTVSLVVPAPGVMLGGTLTEPVVDGLADFTDLSLATAGSYSLLATDGNAMRAVKSIRFAVTG